MIDVVDRLNELDRSTRRSGGGKSNLGKVAAAAATEITRLRDALAESERAVASYQKGRTMTEQTPDDGLAFIKKWAPSGRYPVSGSELYGLLARLEAAERRVKVLEGGVEAVCRCRKQHVQWRRRRRRYRDLRRTYRRRSAPRPRRAGGRRKMKTLLLDRLAEALLTPSAVHYLGPQAPQVAREQAAAVVACLGIEVATVSHQVTALEVEDPKYMPLVREHLREALGRYIACLSVCETSQTVYAPRDPYSTIAEYRLSTLVITRLPTEGAPHG